MWFSVSPAEGSPVTFWGMTLSPGVRSFPCRTRLSIWRRISWLVHTACNVSLWRWIISFKRTEVIIVACGLSRTSRGDSRLLDFTHSVSKLIQMPFPDLSLTNINLERYWSQFSKHRSCNPFAFPPIISDKCRRSGEETSIPGPSIKDFLLLCLTFSYRLLCTLPQEIKTCPGIPTKK